MSDRLALVLLAVCVLGAAPPQTLEQRLFTVASAQPRPWYPVGITSPGALETREQYEARVELATRVLARATLRRLDNGAYEVVPREWRWGRTALVVAVLAHWYEESRFAYEVHAGIKHPLFDQDSGGARCFGQLHSGPVPATEWAQLAGLDEAATERCVVWTARVLTRMARHCSKSRAADLLPMFSAMGGRGCAPTAAGRAKSARFAKMRREIERR